MQNATAKELSPVLRRLMMEAGYAAPELAGRAQVLAQLIVQRCVTQVALMGVANFENEDIAFAVEKIIEGIRDDFGQP